MLQVKHDYKSGTKKFLSYAAVGLNMNKVTIYF